MEVTPVLAASVGYVVEESDRCYVGELAPGFTGARPHRSDRLVLRENLIPTLENAALLMPSPILRIATTIIVNHHQDELLWLFDWLWDLFMGSSPETTSSSFIIVPELAPAGDSCRDCQDALEELPIEAAPDKPAQPVRTLAVATVQ